jgi:hypothetical protein
MNKKNSWDNPIPAFSGVYLKELIDIAKNRLDKMKDDNISSRYLDNKQHVDSFEIIWKEIKSRIVTEKPS